MDLQNTPNRLSRRDWIRDAAITATSAAVLPSFLTGCTDHPIPPTLAIPPTVGVGAPAVGDVPLTNAELKFAADQIDIMRLFIKDLYVYTAKYEVTAFDLINSGTKPTNWTNFIISIFTSIFVGIASAAAFAVPGLGGVVGAAFGIIAQLVKTFAFPDSDRPQNLEARFAEFENAHLQMQIAIVHRLDILIDPGDNYRNLREGWKGDIDFNGKKYTLRDLATSTSTFPTEKNQGTEYVAMWDAAYEQFKKHYWYVMIVKAGSMTYSPNWVVSVADAKRNSEHITPTKYGRDIFYKDPINKANYLRGVYRPHEEYYGEAYYFRKWILTFDGRELSPAAGDELFKDDTPGHITNQKGLFNRDYVFKQFHQEKPDFGGYHDLRKDLEWGINRGDAVGFDLPDDFNFTGGEFHELIKK